jgi:hypothetical protein
MTATSLHPQNGRIGDEGLGEAVMEYLNYYRRPYLVVTEHGDRKHRTPLCPEVRGQVYRLICNEEALYVYGERWCETCRHYDFDLERKDTGWTDPRYRGGHRADV